MNSKNKKDIKNAVEEPIVAYSRNHTPPAKSDVNFEKENLISYQNEEYMTSEVFRQKGLEKLNRICKEHGLL